jgi:hypothetical protein
MKRRPEYQPHTVVAVLAFVVNATLTGTAFAQQFPCAVDIPVNVIMPDAALVRGLNSDAFVVKSKKESVRFSLTTDGLGPRRILFVVETGGRVKKEARTVEQIVLSQFVARAREEDSFALLTARGPRQEVRFGAGREAFRTALTQLEKAPKGKKQSESVLDAVKEGIEWFQQPQPGDAIVLLTMSIGYPPGRAYGQVRKALAAARIRLFGWLLGQYVSSYYSVGVGLAPGPGASGLLPTASLDPNLENIFALGEASGGIVFYENTEGGPWRAYKLTDERKKEIEGLAGQLYKAIVEYYRLQLVLPTPDLTIDVAESMRKELGHGRVIYPRIPSCSVAPNAMSSQ